MFDAYAYFKQFKGKYGIRAVYRVTGLTRLEEMIASVRETQFPCLLIDSGADGVLDLSAGYTSREYHTIHLIDTAEEREYDPARIFEIQQWAFATGQGICRQMVRDAAEPNRPCYGLDSSGIGYFRLGPIGLQGYGYTFNFVMTRDHEYPAGDRS